MLSQAGQAVHDATRKRECVEQLVQLIRSGQIPLDAVAKVCPSGAEDVQCGSTSSVGASQARTPSAPHRHAASSTYRVPATAPLMRLPDELTPSAKMSGGTPLPASGSAAGSVRQPFALNLPLSQPTGSHVVSRSTHHQYLHGVTESRDDKRRKGSSRRSARGRSALRTKYQRARRKS